MRVGVHVMALPQVDGDEVSLSVFEDLVRLADSSGFDRITTGEGAIGKLECITAQTYMAILSKRATIGPMVTNPSTRDPAVAASAVASLDAISNGRAFYALGRGDAGLRNVGLKPATMAQTREYFLAIRDLLREGRATYQGREILLTWPYPLDRIKLYLVAEGPKMLELAGSIADGVYIGTGLLPEVVAADLAHVRTGAIAAGRDPDELDIWWETRCAVASNKEEAIRQVREALCSAGNHALRGDYAAKCVPEEFLGALREYHERYNYLAHGTLTYFASSGEGNKAISNADLMDQLGLTDYFLDRFGVVGTPEEIVHRLEAIEKFGVNQVNLNGWSLEGMRLLGEQVLPKLS